MPQIREKGNSALIILVLVVLVAVLGYFVYSRLKLNQTPAPTPQSVDVFNYGPAVTPSPNQEVGDVSSTSVPLTITYPSDGATLSSTLLTLTGKTSPNAEVFVNDQSGKADVNGNFSVKLTLDEGQNGITVNANDANGNVTEKDISVNVQTF